MAEISQFTTRSVHIQGKALCFDTPPAMGKGLLLGQAHAYLRSIGVYVCASNDNDIDMQRDEARRDDTTNEVRRFICMRTEFSVLEMSIVAGAIEILANTEFVYAFKRARLGRLLNQTKKTEKLQYLVVRTQSVFYLRVKGPP